MSNLNNTIEARQTKILEQNNELKELLRTRLIECGWRDHISRLSRGIIQKHGVDNVRLEQIIDEITPRARSAVPPVVKEELLEKIRNVLKEAN